MSAKKRNNDLKRAVRARMAATGENYTTARRWILSQRAQHGEPAAGAQGRTDWRQPYMLTVTAPGETTTTRAFTSVDGARAAALAVYDARRGSDADDAEAGIGPDDPIRGRWLDGMDAIFAATGAVTVTLPDDTVIAIRDTDFDTLAADAGIDIDPEDDLTVEQENRIVAAFNAAADRQVQTLDAARRSALDELTATALDEDLRRELISDVRAAATVELIDAVLADARENTAETPDAVPGLEWLDERIATRDALVEHLATQHSLHRVDLAAQTMTQLTALHAWDHETGEVGPAHDHAGLTALPAAAQPSAEAGAADIAPSHATRETLHQVVRRALEALDAAAPDVYTTLRADDTLIISQFEAGEETDLDDAALRRFVDGPLRRHVETARDTLFAALQAAGGRGIELAEEIDSFDEILDTLRTVDHDDPSAPLICCEDCGEPVVEDPDGSDGVWVHDRALGDAAYDLDEHHAARPPQQLA